MKLLIAAAALLLAVTANAAPVTFSLQHHVKAVSGDCANQTPGFGGFGCMAVGDIQFGTITFDESVLATDGLLDDFGPFTFQMQFGDIFYSSTVPSELSGFRNRFGFVRIWGSDSNFRIPISAMARRQRGVGIFL